MSLLYITSQTEGSSPETLLNEREKPFHQTPRTQLIRPVRRSATHCHSGGSKCYSQRHVIACDYCTGGRSERQIHTDLCVPFFAEHMRTLTENFACNAFDTANPIFRQRSRRRCQQSKAVRIVTQAVRRRAFTAKTRVESQVAPYGFVVQKMLLRQNIPRVSLFSEYFGCSLSVSFQRHSILIYPFVTNTQ